jgi:hypothetical protein
MFKGTKGRVEFRPHFLAGALASGAWAVGCVSNVAVDDGSVEIQDPSKCPSAMPSPKTSCEGYDVGLHCGEKDPCGPGQEVVCGNNGQWSEVFYSCNPPLLLSECPTSEPADGTSCAQYQAGLECAGLTSCSSGFSCSANDRKWHVAFIDDCNPPPPLRECPEVVPEHGTSCAEYEVGLQCVLDECPWGAPDSTISCGTNGLWQAQYVSCNPPPPPLGGTSNEGGAPNQGEGGAAADEL